MHDSNPVLVIMAWLIAIGGTKTEVSTVRRHLRQKQ